MVRQSKASGASILEPLAIASAATLREHLHMDMASRLRACREQKKLSMAYVAKALDLKAWQAVQQWEKGRAKPSRINLDKLAELYGVPMEFLLHGKALARSKPASIGPSSLAASVAAQFDALSSEGKLAVLDLMASLAHSEQDAEPLPLNN